MNHDCDTSDRTSSKTNLKKQIVNRKSDNKQSIEDNAYSVYSNATLCSLCAMEIPNFIPEYFCGKKYNHACNICEEKDSSWAPDDPFASFPTPTQPSSLVSHWILHLPTKPPQNPGSIPSLITHCVKFPNPGDRFISIQEALEMMREKLDSVFK